MSRLQTTACPPNYKFTGYERDSETGLDYAFARYYSSRLGRFLSTDPLTGSIGSLQSHNAYAYVLNNPGNWTDPTGMWCSADVNGHDTPCNASNFPGDDSCTINGISANCGLAVGLISDGAGIQCPNNICSGIIYAQQGPGGLTTVKQWIPQESWTTGDDVTGYVIHLVIAHWQTTSITYDQALTGFWGTFFGNFVSKDYWKSELSDGGCYAVFGQGFTEGGSSHIIAPLTNGADLPPNIAIDDIIRQGASTAALTYQMSKGLTVPLRSSIYRGILNGGAKAAGGVAAVDFFARSTEGFGREMYALYHGKCK